MYVFIYKYIKKDKYGQVEHVNLWWGLDIIGSFRKV